MSKDPNDARTLLKRMRTGEFVQESTEAINEPVKEMSTRDMLKITRNFVNEDVETDVSLDNSDVQDGDSEGEGSRNVKTRLDQTTEERKLRNFFDDMNVHLELSPIIVKDDKVFWEGVIDGIFQFIFKITGDDDTSGVVFQLLKPGYENSENAKEIEQRVLSYYDTFYKYWEEGLPEA